VGVGAGPGLGTGTGVGDGEGTGDPDDDPEGVPGGHGKVSTHRVPFHTYTGTEEDPSGQSAASAGTGRSAHSGLVVRPPLLELDEITPELDEDDEPDEDEAPELEPPPSVPRWISTEPPHPVTGTPPTTAHERRKARAWDRCMVMGTKSMQCARDPAGGTGRFPQGSAHFARFANARARATLGRP
jgi:hypothetical protein